MAGFFQEFASSVSAGFFGNDYLRDYQHASKTFVTNAYGYAPKYKFLFHVYFDLNESLIGSLSDMPTDRNYGLAVKTVQLPKYTFDLHTMNQYNRKRVVQTKIKYDPVNIVFHDDNSSLITKLWHNYYTYYYKDGEQPDPMATINKSNTALKSLSNNYNTQDINQRNIYEPDISGNDDWGYVGEPALTSAGYQTSKLGGVVKTPFFRSINIYGFNQHNFILYRLINPVIESFSHDTYDYSQGNGVMEHQMSLQYETVKYYAGAIDGKKPSEIITGFGDSSHYDTTTSPIATPGSNSTILGQGGLLDAAGGFQDALSSGNYLGALKIAGTTLNTFKNPASIVNAAKGDALGVATNWLQGTPNRNTQFNFPTAQQVVSNTNTAITKAVNTAIGK